MGGNVATITSSNAVYHGNSLTLGLVPGHYLLHLSVPGRPRTEHLCPNKARVGRIRVILNMTGTVPDETAALAACPAAGRDEA